MNVDLRTAAGRRFFYRYWIRDPLVGGRLIATHEILRLLPTPLVSRIGAELGSLFGPRLHPKVGERARAALRVLRPDLSADDRALSASVGRIWRSLGQAYAEFATEDRFWDEGRVAVEGAEHLAAAKARGKPVIVAGVHLGNWELLPITLGYLGHKVIDVYQPQKNRFEDDIAHRTRIRIAEHILRSVSSFHETSLQEVFRLVAPSAGAGAKLLQGLNGGYTLMMFVDESAGGRVHAPRFGRAERSDGNLGRVVRLARMVDAAVVPAYVTRSEDVHFKVHFCAPLSLVSTGSPKADAQVNIGRLDAVITPLVLENIEQWYMIADYRHDR